MLASVSVQKLVKELKEMNRCLDPRTTWSPMRWAACLLSFAPAFCFAGDLPKEFTLGRYIPQGAWFYVHYAHNPQRAWIDQAWSEVLDAAKDSGVIGDVTSLLLSSMDDQQSTKAREGIENATRLINSVDWSSLTEREYVFAERMAACCVGYEYMFLARGSEGSGSKNFEALAAIQDELASLAGIDVVESMVGEIPVRSARFSGGGELAKLGFSIELFRKGDLIGVVTGKKSLTDVVGLLQGKSQVQPIAESKRFIAAMSNVPTPRDAITYFDVKRFVGEFRSMMERVPPSRQVASQRPDDSKGETAPRRANDNPQRRPMRFLRMLAREADVVDYSVTTVATDGMKQWSRCYLQLQDSARSSRPAKAVLDHKAFEQFDQFIPANATSFSLSATVDIERVYKAVRSSVAQIEPQAGATLDAFEAQLAGMGFDIQKDLFDWLSGEMIRVEMPASVPTPMNQTDQVLMIRVKDPKLAEKKVNRAIHKLAAILQGKGQMLMITPAPVKAKGFQQVTHPLFAMLFRPVVGVYQNWLILGSSAGGINACLAVASGDAPSIATNKRFQREGLAPKGAARSVSYKDTSNWGQDQAKALTMASTFGTMMIAGMGENDDQTRQTKRIASGLLEIAMKVGPILQRVNFYSSEASISVYDGAQSIRTESLVTYKKPAPNPLDPHPPVPVLTRKPVRPAG